MQSVVVLVMPWVFILFKPCGGAYGVHGNAMLVPPRPDSGA